MAVWLYTLRIKDVFYNEGMSFEEKRDEIVKRIKASDFWNSDDLVLVIIVDGLAGSEDTEEFDGWWSTFYDYADYYRVWVETV